MHINNHLPSVLGGHETSDPMWRLLDRMPKAALFDVMIDLLSLRHPDGCDAGLADTKWLVDEARKMASARGWKVNIKLGPCVNRAAMGRERAGKG